MKHVSIELFSFVRSEANALNESVNLWLASNPHKRNFFIQQLSLLFEKKHLRYSCLEMAIWTGPDLFRSLRLFDGPYCRRAANLIIAYLDLLNVALQVFQIQTAHNFQNPKKSPVCEDWLYETISQASQQMIDRLYKDSEKNNGELYGSKEMEKKFAILLEKMETQEYFQRQPIERRYLQECPVCKELEIFL